jgi:hypothetical protein
MSLFIFWQCRIIQLLYILVKINKLTRRLYIFAFLLVLLDSFSLSHILETKFAQVKHFLLTIFLRVRTKVPSIDLIWTKKDFFNISYFCSFLMLFLKSINFRIIVHKLLICRIDFILLSLRVTCHPFLNLLR